MKLITKDKANNCPTVSQLLLLLLLQLLSVTVSISELILSQSNYTLVSKHTINWDLCKSYYSLVQM